jgi:hypothetical protein
MICQGAAAGVFTGCEKNLGVGNQIYSVVVAHCICLINAVCKFLVFEYVEFLAFWFLFSRNAVALV